MLHRILRHKREEIERRKGAKPLDVVRAEAAAAPPPRDLAAALRPPGEPGARGVRLIAEIKRASPSRGPLRPDLDPAALAREYEAHGAAAISVLTDRRFFQGSLDDLRAVRQQVALPVLRKDFILDPYQVYETRAADADALLLIVAALDDEELTTLYRLTYELGMAALVEVHNAAELERALAVVRADDRGAGPSFRPIVGVNNRDLHTFAVDLETTVRLRPRIPPDVILAAESGVHTRADAARLAAIGADALLVGEALVRAPDPGAQIRHLTQYAIPGTQYPVRLKICGLTNLDDARCAAEAGADFLGFVLYPPSPRFVPPERVAAITTALRREFGEDAPRCVGVFVDEPVERVQAVLERAGLDLAQLHGNEPPEAVRLLLPRAFKALRPRTPAEAEASLAVYRDALPDDEAVPQLLVDAYHPRQFGGTGLSADLAAAQSLARRVRLLLAGGLTPETVGAAIEGVRPWGVDVSSGVERAPGLKDHARIQALVQAVQT